MFRVLNDGTWDNYDVIIPDRHYFTEVVAKKDHVKWSNQHQEILQFRFKFLKPLQKKVVPLQLVN